MGQQSMQDRDLIRQIRSGDKEAFESLYRSCFSGLCQFVDRFVDMPAVSEELVQELFFDIWLRRVTWNPKGGARAYLFRAARNRALDYLKHKKVERAYLEEQKLEYALNSGRYFDNNLDVLPFNDDESSTLERAIQAAIEQLPEQRRTIFLMSRDDGLSYREIAHVLDISVKTVETQIGRSLKALRSTLSGKLPSTDPF